jgi:hypothetical protein
MKKSSRAIGRPASLSSSPLFLFFNFAFSNGVEVAHGLGSSIKPLTPLFGEERV